MRPPASPVVRAPWTLRALVLLTAVGALAGAPARAHQFGVIGNSFGSSGNGSGSGGGGEAQRRQALAADSATALDFVVVVGIKGADEPCSDKLYQQRLALLVEARRPVVLAPAASDWSACRNGAGRSDAIERLNRLRELYFGDAAALGTPRLTLTRLSDSAKFRSYAENAQWVVGKVLYATVNLPANNNRYRPEAGRNSEFEDRLVANRFWIKRLFALARRDKFDALVLFSEGDVKALEEPAGLRALLARTPERQDGFAEPRRQIVALAQKFKGRVLLVDGAAAEKAPAIAWRANLGHVSVGAGAVQLRVTSDSAQPFSVVK